MLWGKGVGVNTITAGVGVGSAGAGVSVITENSERLHASPVSASKPKINQKTVLLRIGPKTAPLHLDCVQGQAKTGSLGQATCGSKDFY
jgi:hypothetical protein